MLRNRAEAGRLLGAALAGYANRDEVILLALPRGGVPVAFEAAALLSAPLDVFVVRKLGAPRQRELALGAIAGGGVRVLNRELIEKLKLGPERIERIDAKERRELERRELAYRRGRPPPKLAGKIVILIDDGLATGSTMLAAVEAVRAEHPVRVVVAVPVADAEMLALLRGRADQAVCLLTPHPMRAVGSWYENFEQTTDEEVRELLERARQLPGRGRQAEHARRRADG